MREKQVKHITRYAPSPAGVSACSMHASHSTLATLSWCLKHYGATDLDNRPTLLSLSIERSWHKPPSRVGLSQGTAASTTAAAAPAASLLAGQPGAAGGLPVLHRMLAVRIMLLPLPPAALSALTAGGSPNTFQKRSVSSAPAVTTEAPSGDCAMCSTRAVCPVSSAACRTDKDTGNGYGAAASTTKHTDWSGP